MSYNNFRSPEEKAHWETGIHHLGYNVVIGGAHGVIFDQICPTEEAAFSLLSSKQKELGALPALCAVRPIVENTYGARALQSSGGRKARKLLRAGRVTPKQIHTSTHEIRFVP